MTRILLTILVFAGTLFGLPGTGAQARPVVGVGDQSAAMFADKNFKTLHVKQARLIVPYDVINVPKDRLATDAWVKAARAAAVNPLISFEHSRAQPKKRPTVAQYTQAFKAFRQHYPLINTYSAWNEANHQSQPTYHRAKLAAEYYNAMRATCPSCKIVALDVLDQGGMVDYVKTFQQFAKKPKIWGLHNYRDTNRFLTKGTTSLLKITKGQVWLTETGGIVNFSSVFPYSEERAARALKHMFKLASSNPRLKRVYTYAWFGEPRGARFDAGLVGPTGKPRQGYYVVKDNLGH